MTLSAAFKSLAVFLVSVASTGAVAAEMPTTFDGAKDAILGEARANLPEDFGFYTFEATGVALDGKLAPGAVVKATGNTMKPAQGGGFEVTTTSYEYSLAGGLKVVTKTEHANGGAWLRSPVFGAGEGLKLRLTVPALTDALRGKNRRFDAYSRIRIGFTNDGGDASLHWIATYERIRNFLPDYEETAHTDDATGKTFFLRTDLGRANRDFGAFFPSKPLF